MSEPTDPNWPRLLGLSVHEFRSPLTVVSGYISMLLKESAGPLNDKQKYMLQEAAKSSGRMTDLLQETSNLANLEAGTTKLNRSAVELRGLVADVIAELPPSPDRDVSVLLEDGDGHAPVLADRKELKKALTSVLWALRRELVTSAELLVREQRRDYQGGPAAWVSIGDAALLEAIDTAGEPGLTTFDEWRGGVGLSLAIARRIVEAHGGRLYSLPKNPAEEKEGDREGPRKEGAKAAAVMVLPLR